ncbi:MAG: hypothetical protein ACE5Q5_07265 [Nitrosarchaeum sp.]
MKTIIIIVLAVIVGLVLLGGGLGPFLSNVEEGTSKIKQNEQLQDIKNQIASKIVPSEKSDEIPEETPAPTQIECDSSYPDVCIATYPPDLSCKDVPFSNFRVLQPDPHGFDMDKNGIGCEK